MFIRAIEQDCEFPGSLYILFQLSTVPRADG
jgi:hypothetical protein